MLPKEAIIEYQQIYEAQFGTEISFDEAMRQGTQLINLMRIIYKPIPAENEKRFRGKPKN